MHAEETLKTNTTWNSKYESIVFIFPSKLHRKKVEFLLLKPDFPTNKFDSLEHFCLTSLRNFKQIVLRNTDPRLGSGGLRKTVEAQHQSEFYRSCYEILGNTIFLLSEYSAVGLRGRIDFYIPSAKWGIELVRDGDRLQQHIDRFLFGGFYYEWIERGDLEAYILIDFRTSKPPKIDRK